MTNFDDDNQPKGLQDLITESQKSPKPKIAEKEVKEKFTEKIEKIRIKRLEEAAVKAAASSGYPYVNLVAMPINSETLNSIPRALSAQEKVVCFYISNKVIKIGSTDPANPKLAPILKDLAANTLTNKGEIYLISQHSLDVTNKLYDRFPPPREFIYGIKITGDELAELQKILVNFGVLNAKLNEEKNLTLLFKMLVAGAMEADASDIHIEAEEKKVVVRYRVDGVLHIVATLPIKLFQRLDARVKNIAGLKINVTEKPQDGRITVFLKADDKMEIRVSTLPTAYGESIVMRLLKSKVTSLGFEDLGLRGKSYDDLKHQVERPTGMIVTTGPTGSGKTTTLYAILNKLNDPETKIITLEDPIEYKLEGVSQSQIDHSRGYSFANGLRSILRQDPDIIMVGELRDLETSEVAIQAALTGHKVVSTLHTNDAAGAIPRFLSMGVKTFLLAPALNAVIGQRLVRKVCSHCRIEHQPSAEFIERVKQQLNNLPVNSGYTIDLNKLKFYRGQGCDVCNHIGLKGRIGIYEIFTITDEIEKEILSGKTSEYRIAEIAHTNGMITMVQDGILKAMDGITTVEEIFRVVE